MYQLTNNVLPGHSLCTKDCFIGAGGSVSTLSNHSPYPDPFPFLHIPNAEGTLAPDSSGLEPFYIPCTWPASLLSHTSRALAGLPP